MADSEIELHGNCELCGETTGTMKLYRLGNQVLCLGHFEQKKSQKNAAKQIKEGERVTDFLNQIWS